MSPPMPVLLAESTSFWKLVVSSIHASSWVENLILLVLLVASVASWAIAVWKIVVLRNAREGNARVARLAEASESPQAIAQRIVHLSACPNAAVYLAAIEVLSAGRVSAAPLTAKARVAMDHASRGAAAKLHLGMHLLASIASSTPFIGLLGTVLGIMSTFQVLGSAKSASLNVVAPGIAAALIATAAGLGVAIPAVFLYNALNARIDDLQDQADMFLEDLNLRYFGEADEAGAHSSNHRHEPAEPVTVGEGAHVPGDRY